MHLKNDFYADERRSYEQWSAKTVVKKTICF